MAYAVAGRASTGVRLLRRHRGVGCVLACGDQPPPRGQARAGHGDPGRSGGCRRSRLETPLGTSRCRWSALALVVAGDLASRGAVARLGFLAVGAVEAGSGRLHHRRRPGTDQQPDRRPHRHLDHGGRLLPTLRLSSRPASGDVHPETVAVGVVHARAHPRAQANRVRGCQACCSPSWLASIVVPQRLISVSMASRWSATSPMGSPNSPDCPTCHARRPRGGSFRSLIGIALVGYTDNVLTARSIACPSRLPHRRQPGSWPRSWPHEPGLRDLAGLPDLLERQLHRGAGLPGQPERSSCPCFGSASVVVGTLLRTRPAPRYIPRAALAAVIVSVAIAIIDVPRLPRPVAGEPRGGGAGRLSPRPGVVVSGLVGRGRRRCPSTAGGALPCCPSTRCDPRRSTLGLDGWVDVDAYPAARTEPGLLGQSHSTHRSSS